MAINHETAVAVITLMTYLRYSILKIFKYRPNTIYSILISCVDLLNAIMLRVVVNVMLNSF